MKYEPQFPYIKVYSDSKNQVRCVWQSSMSAHGIYEEEMIGNKLIAFLLTDLSDYKKQIQEVFYSEDKISGDLDEMVFVMLNAEIYSIAKLQQKQWSKQAQKMRKAYLAGDITAP